ncbi:GmrSD restriction endonuclease domain-containing protein [Acidovorax sp. LjRoot194]|uniref:GmrSD restriction endonuclease domain-containing protein n=1 Tax=Acidovorax sp. LjRoot194 TaxID=3342280 RepID=UPI003ED0E974
MGVQRYAVNQYMIESVLAKVREGEIAIPEIQRPFVWDGSQVRDLMDSLYKGYPVGYLIAWRNPDVKLKDGRMALGKMILIDGQQRVTALTAAVLGQQVINKDYRKVNIRIAFHPLKEVFEVSNTAIERDASWIADIAPIVSGKISLLKAIREYYQANPSVDEELIEKALSALTDIAKKQIGLIELDHDLDIETVTEIFIRINSKGTVLSQADFAMSKIAADTRFGGPELRKAIDYFCHMAMEPGFHDQLKERDPEFAASDFFQKISWLRNDNDTLYDPSYTDVLRVTFGTEFGRGKLADLVSLLSGRNFATKQFEESIAEESFAKLANGVRRYINETHFQRFVIIIKSAGFIVNNMVRSQNALNFAYALYLGLRARGVDESKIERLVRRWFVLSILTSRFSGAAETQFERDIRLINEPDFADVLARIEQAELSDAFWQFGLVQALDVASTNHPLFWVFVAAQIKANDKGLLSRDVTVRELVSNLGDVHHIFPRQLLKANGKGRGDYNQIANYAYTQDAINIKIGSRSPHLYFADAQAQCQGQPMTLGGIDQQEELLENLRANCVPTSALTMTASNFPEFLAQRRVLMASKIRDYYKAL